MSQAHVDQMLAILCLGIDPQHHAEVAIEDFGIKTKDVLDISTPWTLAPEGSYDPHGDLPDELWVCGDPLGVTQLTPTELWVVGDNGDCAFGFKFTK